MFQGDIVSSLLFPSALLVIGWLLNETTHDMREKSDRKRRLRRAMAYLMACLALMKRRARVLEASKDIARSIDDYQAIRKQIRRRFEDDQATLQSEADDAISTFSDYLPFELNTLRAVGKAMGRHPSLAFDAASAASSEAFIKLISAVEVAEEGLQTPVKSLLKSVAWRIGPITWVRQIHWQNKMDNPPESQKRNEEFITAFLTDVMGQTDPKATSEEKLDQG